MFRFPFDPGVAAACACSDGAARIEMQGEEFVGQFNGSISVRIGRPEQQPTREIRVPLNIIGYSTQSDVKGMGTTSLDFDFSRPIPASDVSGDPERGFFPGVQKMRLNILMTTDALPKVVLRSANRGVLINEQVREFPPPPGATYVLQNPVRLVDARNPGRVLARLVSVNTSIVSTTVEPHEIVVGSGVRIFAPDEKSFANAPSVSFTIPHSGMVQVRLYSESGGRLRSAFEGPLEAGRHTVPVDTTRLRREVHYYQLFLDGVAVSARMRLKLPLR